MDIIDPNKPIQTTAEPKKEKVQLKPGQSTFDAVFKQRLGEGNVQPSVPDSLSLPSAVHPAQFASQSQSSGRIIVDQVHQLVDTLTAYQNKLADRETTMKEPTTTNTLASTASAPLTPQTAEATTGMAIPPAPMTATTLFSALVAWISSSSTLTTQILPLVFWTGLTSGLKTIMSAGRLL